MGWVKKKPEDHKCELPLEYPGRGSIWACDHCGKQWKWTGTEWFPVFRKRRLKEPKA